MGIVAVFTFIRIVVACDLHCVFVAIPQYVGSLAVLFLELFDDVIASNLSQILGDECFEIMLRVIRVVVDVIVAISGYPLSIL